jgi:aromatic-amino-acid transaminase
MEQDAYALRALVAARQTLLVSNSFSNIFSLYGERVGGLTAVCESAEATVRVLGQLKAVVRQLLQSSHHARRVGGARAGGRAAHGFVDCRGRADAPAHSPHALQACCSLERVQPSGQFDHLTQQRGMFSHTGLTAAQVDRLRDEYGIYMLRSGRICLAGVNATTLGVSRMPWPPYSEPLRRGPPTLAQVEKSRGPSAEKKMVGSTPDLRIERMPSWLQKHN